MLSSIQLALMAVLAADGSHSPRVAAPSSTTAPQGEEEQYGRQQRTGEYGPFFEDEPPSDTAHPSALQPTNKPLFSIGNGGFCFVDGARCKVALLASAGVGFGVRAPASDVGPDVPYSMFVVQGGVVTRPFMLARRQWHPWGLGVVASWSRGTGSVTVSGAGQDQTVKSTKRTDAVRVAVLNRIWLSKKPWGLHLDFTLGAVRSEVLTSGRNLWGTTGEVGLGFGGWATIFTGGDFLDRDARLVFGVRTHGLAAGPLIAMVLAGMAIGGAL